MNTTPPAAFTNDVEWTLPCNFLYYAYRGVTTVTTLNLKRILDLYHACYVCVYTPYGGCVTFQSMYVHEYTSLQSMQGIPSTRYTLRSRTHKGAE